MITINEKISYIPASENPLSADIGIVQDNGNTWLFDLGADEHVISDLTDKYNIVISHFHQDHTGNIYRLSINQAYVSSETRRHIGFGNLVDQDIFIGGIHIFPLPSSHCKGCLGMEINETYAFVGDALYSKSKAGNRIYNVTLLKDSIDTIKRIKAQYLLVSHFPGLVRPKDEVIHELEMLYNLREKGNPIVSIPSDEHI